MDETVKKYLEELKKLGIGFEILHHPQLVSVEKVQEYLGFGMSDAGATLLMKADDKFVAIIKRGDTKLDSEKVKKYLGVNNLRMANEKEFAEITGVPSGAATVYIKGIPIYLDKKVLEKEYINAGSGSLLVTLRCRTEDFKKIPGIKISDLTELGIGKVSSKKTITGKKRILSGITPSGDGTLHIGNYLGAVRQFIEFAKTHDCFLMVADLHALTTVQNKETLQKNTENLILNELALLGDLTPSAGSGLGNLTFFRQSDVPMHAELTWIFNNVTPLGLLKRAHAYKDKLQNETKEEDVNLGLFNYPILMAADILLYKPDFVPVGRDQKQHIEIARDIAERFNKTFKSKVFPLPEPHIPEEAAVIMGTDGKRKMSKSLGNVIGIFDDEAVIKKQVMSTYTDPTRVHATDPGHIEGNMVFTYLDFLGDKEEVSKYKEKYKQGFVADVEVKNYLYETLLKYFTPARERYQELRSNPAKVKKILESGAEKARIVAGATMTEVRHAIGLTNAYSFFKY